jgi:hypothetical protein
MPTIITIGSVRVRVYGGEHGRPHFHLVGVRNAAVVALDTLEVLDGVMDKDLQQALKWAREHMDEIWVVWRQYNEGRP